MHVPIGGMRKELNYGQSIVQKCYEAIKGTSPTSLVPVSAFVTQVVGKTVEQIDTQL